MVNDNEIGLPYLKPGLSIREVSSILTRLTSNLGFDIIWDKKSRIYIKLEPKYRGKVHQ